MANTGRRRHRRELFAAVAIGTVLFPWGSVTALQDASLDADSYGWDPAGIIAGSSELRNHTLGTDVWDVWVCDAPDGSVPLTPAGIVETLKAEIVPYFEWLSDGRYQPDFRAAGTVSEGSSCVGSVRAASVTNPNGVLIVRDVASNGGSAQAGIWCPYEGLCPPSAMTFPDNYRSVTVDAHAVVGSRPRLVTVVHEMAHALHFPHVYSGETSGTWAEYDDPTDVMSQAGDRTKLMGTTPVNRYAAGWFDPDQIEYADGGGTFTLDPVGGAGTQMVVVPHGAAGWFTAIGARVRQSYDASLPYEGVVVHLIDQRPSSCGGSITCFALSRRTRQWPAVAGEYGHLVPVGGSIELADGYALSVQEGGGAGFVIEVIDVAGPAAPTSLNVEGRSADQVELRWAAAVDNHQVAGYRVEIDGSLEGSTTGETYSLDGLQPNSTYRITVRGIDAAGNSGSAAEVTVATLPRSANLFFHNPRSGRWQLTMADGGVLDFFYGVPGDLPMMCDWDGDGIETVGLYRGRTGFMYLRDSNSFGIAEREFFFGMRDDVPVCGDWDGDGVDTVGIFRPSASRFFLRNTHTTGFADTEVAFGRPGDEPFAGDWDGDGVDTLGVYRPSDQMLYFHGGGFTPVGDYEVVVGDLDGDERDDVAYFDPGSKLLISGDRSGSAAKLVQLGGPGWNLGAGWWG